MGWGILFVGLECGLLACAAATAAHYLVYSSLAVVGFSIRRGVKSSLVCRCVALFFSAVGDWSIVETKLVSRWVSQIGAKWPSANRA